MTTLRMLLALGCGLALTANLSAADVTVKMTLNGQIAALAQDVQQALKTDPRVMNQTLALGAFAPQGRRVKDSNYGQRLEREFRRLLSASLRDESKLTLAGSYHFVEGESADNRGADVLVLTVQIQNDRGKEIIPFTREVNDTDDILGALGRTGAAPADPKATFKERNDAAKQAVEKPTFLTLDGGRVAAVGRQQWSVRVLKKTNADGPGQPVMPQNVGGLAYVPLSVRDYYEIELFNDDASDAVATVTVDGLDVANTFSVDKNSQGQAIVWPGYLVHRAENGKTGRGLIRGWLHTIAPTSTKDNVFAFLVTEHGQGAASALKQRGGIGVITVQFREACPRDQKLSGRSFGETAKGEGLEEKYSVKPVLIGENVLSTVSIRYNVPQP